MPAPSSWVAPANDGSIPSVGSNATVSYIDGLWIVKTTERYSRYAKTYIRWATDPYGVWNVYEIENVGASGELFAPFGNMRSNVEKQGDLYYFMASTMYESNLGDMYSGHLLYATDLDGPWTAENLTTSTVPDGPIYYPIYQGYRLRYVNGEWLFLGSMYGTYPVTTVAFGLSSTSLTDLPYSDPEYVPPPAHTGPSQPLSIWGDAVYDEDSGLYIRVYSWNDAGDINPSLIEYSDSLYGPWTASTPEFTGDTSAPDGAYGLLSNEGNPPLRKINGYWVAVASRYYSGAQQSPAILYASDPTGTWTVVEGADHGLTGTGTGPSFTHIDYKAGYWLLSGGSFGTSATFPRFAYMRAGRNEPPTGPFTSVNSGLNLSSRSTHPYVTQFAYGGGNLVCVSYGGNIRVTYVGADGESPALLRQRQSEVRTPSRVRGVDLRQRQTPYIR